MGKKISVSVLGIGTELTSGQILNRNAVWISKKMKALGAETCMHLVVPDERVLILEALETCARHSDILFVTGGLGPTSDDFTRDLIAQWTGLEMQWDEASWQHLNARLAPRGIPVREIQRQQCYFPVGSKILVNHMGTANGFYLSFKDKDIFVLPGPPREIESIWNDWIALMVTAKCQGIERQITKSWDTIGFGESQIAELAEEALVGCNFEKAYRVHVPYVEFKLTYWSSQEQEANKFCAQVDQALQPMTLLKDGEDIAEKLCQKLENYPIVSIVDSSSGSFLLKRISEFQKNLLRKIDFTTGNSSKNISRHAGLHLELICDGTAEAEAKWTFAGVSQSEILKAPYKSLLQQERAHQYFAEMAMISFYRQIEKAQKI